VGRIGWEGSPTYSFATRSGSISARSWTRWELRRPPGSGKTIVGLGSIRRFDEPAVVFAPTATIQQQWCEEIGLFTEDPTGDLVSREPRRFAPINIYTYQLISAPGESRELLRETALKMWLEELLKREGVSEGDARGRPETMRCNNPDAYGKELSRRAGRAKRDLLRRGDVGVARFLHPNARALIDGLVDCGVKTVILDECHHLLDYWAVVLRYLIGRIRGQQVVGLTATLPSPEESVRVAEKSDGYEVSLEDASPEDAAVFIRSYRQIFAPVRDQRYLILRNEHRLPNRALRYTWILFRRFGDYPPAYHPVPDVLATRKENAQVFSRYWQRYVGGGTFVYTRTARGRRMLLGARAQRRPEPRDLAFEVWK
jgi:hypothetical protein